MKRRKQAVGGLMWGCLVLGIALPIAAQDLDTSLAFQAESIDGRSISVQVSEETQSTVICFLGTECPLARLYGPRLQEMADSMAGHKVRFVGVMSNVQDSADEIHAYATQHGITFPVIHDEANVIADRYKATRTPEVVVLDSELSIRYRGRIDDQYLPGLARTAPERQDLKIALEELLAARDVSVPTTEPVGCLIGRVKQAQVHSDVTYANQVSRLLNQHCVECHRPNEIGPFSLTEYEEVAGWGDMILEVVESGRMPPWHANPSHGTFKNARIMPEADKQLLRDWVAAGAPLGDPAQIPEVPEFVQGWQLPREPDLVISMRDRSFHVPADGTVEYQYFVVDPGFTEDRWVSAAQVIPGNPAVVHHSIVFVRPPDGARFRGVGWLGAYVPGQRPFALPAGRARFVPAGSKLVFQQHYTPNGAAQDDMTKIGLLFADDNEVTHEAFTLVGIDQEFEIPPHAADYEVEGTVRWFPPDGELLAVMPHMHLRGRSFRFVADCNDESRIVLDVPRYDFNWQHVYELQEALRLNTVDTLKFSVTFDNSDQNPANPDPTQYVTWGDQTWEEMAVAFFEVAEARSESGNRRAPSENAESDDLASVEQQVTSFVDRFFARFDANGDGKVTRMETPLAFRQWGFSQFDLDQDHQLTRDEIAASARHRFRN